jgi:hypothetical protein
VSNIVKNPNSPFPFKTRHNTTVEQFYNSIDKEYHLAEYVPYAIPPTEFLCRKIGNFTIGRASHSVVRCELCFNIFINHLVGIGENSETR